jgi:hypothetical protein
MDRCLDDLETSDDVRSPRAAARVISFQASSPMTSF